MPSVPPSTGGHAERQAFPRDRHQAGDPLRPAASWGSFASAQPELAARIRQRFSAHTHLTMATVRADGTPRISGNEVRIRAGVLYLAGLVGARRFEDLRARPGVAVHSGSDDTDAWTGDAKLTGLAREVTDLAERAAFVGSLSQEAPAWTFELFAVDILDATTIELTPEKDALLITTWSPLHGVRVFRR